MKTVKYDVLVVGGGTTGVCAAIAAARNGVKTAIVETQGFLGGNACNGMAWYGFHAVDDGRQVVAGLPLEIIERLRQLDGASEFCLDPVAGSMVQVNSALLKIVLLKMCLEETIKIHFHSTLTEIKECTADRQLSVIQCKLEKKYIESRVIIDCTDSGDAAVAAGASWHLGRETDGKMQPASSTLFIRGVDMEEMLVYFDEHPDQLRPIPVPEEELKKLVKRMHHVSVFGMGAFPDIIAKAKSEGLQDYPRDRLVGQAFVKNGELMLVASRVDGADPTDEEAWSNAEIKGFMQHEVTLKLLKNYIPGCKNAYISGCGHTVGLRETRHIKGDYVLTTEDLVQGTDFYDGIALGAYHLDVHSPDHQGIDTEHPKTYKIPYRIMLPENIEGLLIAGRACSATQGAQASFRVIPISGAMGQAAGLAAALAVSQNKTVRNVDIAALQKKLKFNGAILP